jgi:hypothetical protein
VGSRAALTGLTYLYQGVLARNLDYLDPNSNWYARRLRQGTALGREWKDDETTAYREVESFFAEKQKREAPGGGRRRRPGRLGQRRVGEGSTAPGEGRCGARRECGGGV